jgi:hypothetical protein
LGKSVTDSFASLAALGKAQKEVAEYHRCRELSRQLVQVNERICRLRPVPEAPTESASSQKKTREAIHQEVRQEVDGLLGVIFSGRGKAGGIDLEAVEMAMRSALRAPQGEATAPAEIEAKHQEPKQRARTEETTRKEERKRDNTKNQLFRWDQIRRSKGANQVDKAKRGLLQFYVSGSCCRGVAQGGVVAEVGP